jgi:hypothetical protein
MVIESLVALLLLVTAGRRAMMIMEQVDSGRIAALLDDFNETAN